jgi:energy-coupling factor transporter ATP-binding protein EcfA2
MAAPPTSLGSATDHNPFPGLRSFRADEDYLFFGRENQVNSMVDKLSTTRFLAVVGSSGSGKSSLVNCGLCPALHRGLMTKAGTSWRIAYFRPGSDPIRAMARALAREGVLFDRFEVDGMSLEAIVEATLRMSNLGLVDIQEQAQGDTGDNLLVVVDQFEELFRFRSLALGSNQRERARDTLAFVNLLLQAAKHSRARIYVVLTMRSDFLGDCAQVLGLPEAINEGQYLVPRMTRDELRTAIAGPVGVPGAEISPVLLTRLINDAGDNPDQLPILQHALNRTWARWQHAGKAEGALGLSQYDAVGGMSNALEQHAEKALAELHGERSKRLAEKIFKALTDKGTDARGIRRPTKFGSLCALAEAPADEVARVINVFRKPSRSFLMPPRDEDLEPETVIDISHESLMRVWTRLRNWVEEEAESASRYRRLAESAELHARGEGGLMTEPELSLTLAWQRSTQPNAAWAERYCAGFDRAAAFLGQSQRERDAAARAAELRLKREQWRRRWISIAVLVSFLFGAYAWQADSARTEAEGARAEAEQARAEAEQARAEAEKARGLAEQALAEKAATELLTDKVTRSRANLQLAQATLAGLRYSLSYQEDRQKIRETKQKITEAEADVEALARLAEEAAARLGNALIIPPNSIRRLDLFDVAQSTVTSTSGARAAANMFGAEPGSPDLGMSDDSSVAFFEDGKPADYAHWIEWQTSGAVRIESVGLFARHDSIDVGYEFRRAFRQFKLYAKTQSGWTEIADFTPTLPYGGGEKRTALAVCVAVTPITATEFRAEFVQAVDIFGRFSAPRIVALDGNSSKCSDQYPQTPEQSTKITPEQATKSTRGELPRAIAGTWHGSGGSSDIRQEATKLTIDLGERRSASGTIRGSDIQVSFGDDPGCCTGTLSPDGMTIRWSNATTWTRSRISGPMSARDD